MPPIVIRISKCQKWIGLFALSIMLLSCQVFKKSSHSEPCYIDKENLIIIGNDTTIQTISSGIRPDYLFRAIHKLKDRPPKFIYLDDDKSILPEIKFKIEGCQDLDWARNELIEIINEKYNYIEKDTVLAKRDYLIKVIDSTKIKPCIEGVPWEMKSQNVKLENKRFRKSQVRCYDWSVVLSMVSGQFSPSIHQFSMDTLQVSPIYFEMYTGFRDVFGDDLYKQYLNDSLGLDLVVLDEDSITMKAYKYLGEKDREDY